MANLKAVPSLLLQRICGAAALHVAMATLVLAIGFCSCRIVEAQISQQQQPTKSTGAANSLPDSLSITGRVVNEQGQPVSRAEVLLLEPARARATVTTQPDGTFSFALHDARGNSRQVWVKNADCTQQGFLSIDDVKSAGTVDQPLTITLKPAREVKVTVVDAAGTPIKDAQVAVLTSSMNALLATNTGPDGTLTLKLPTDATIGQIVAFKSGAGFDYYTTQTSARVWKFGSLPDIVKLALTGVRTVRIKAVDSANHPVTRVPILPWYVALDGKTGDVNLAGCELTNVDTDASGTATFDWLPSKFLRGIPFLAHSDGYSSVEVPNVKPDDQQTDITMPVLRKAKLSGHVVLPNGQPAAGIQVLASGAGVAQHNGNGRALTDSDGAYEMIVNSEEAYVVAVADDHWAAPSHIGVVVREDQDVGNIDFTLAEGTILKGTVTVGSDNRSAANQYIGLTTRAGEIPAELKKPGDRGYHEVRHSSGTQTDAGGNYQLCVGPGTYQLSGPMYTEPVTIVVEHEREIVHDFHMPRAELGPITGKVIDADGKPVPSAKIQGIYLAFARRGDITENAAADGTFQTERVLVPAVIYAQTADGQQAGTARIDDEQPDVTIRVTRLATAHGRLFDHEGNIVPGGKINYYVPVYEGEPGKSTFRMSFGGSEIADAQGRFTLQGLLPGEEYQVAYSTDASRGASTRVTQFTPASAETIELGDIKIPKPYHPPTVDELTAQYFSQHDNLTERISAAKKFDAAQFLRLLLIVGDPQSELAHKYVAARRGEGNLLGSLNDFEQLAVPTDDAAAMAVLKQTYNLDASQLKPLSLVVLGDEGQVLGTKNLSPDSAANHDETLATAIADFTKPFNPPHPDAEQLLADAQDRARRGGKHGIHFLLPFQNGP